jgi:hypothetical protein
MDDLLYLVPTSTVDFEHPEVMAFVEEHSSTNAGDWENQWALPFRRSAAGRDRANVYKRVQTIIGHEQSSFENDINQENVFNTPST